MDAHLDKSKGSEAYTAFIGYRFKNDEYYVELCPLCPDATAVRIDWADWKIVECLCDRHHYMMNCKRMGESSE